MEQRKTGRDWAGRFIGPRINCENVPCLPVKVLAWVLDDPRHIPYLLVWKDPHFGDVVEVVRVCSYSRPDSLDWTGWVEVKRADGSRSLIRTVQYAMPRNGGRASLIICPLCQEPRQGLYAWRLNPHRLHAAVVDSWKCRECAQLRYASEGGALLHRPRTALGKMLAAIDNFTRHDRPEPLYLYVFTNPTDVKTIL